MTHLVWTFVACSCTLTTIMSIHFNQVSKAYANKTIIENLSFELPSPGLYSIIGESGCGKTTCAKLMNGIIAPTRGEIFINQEKLTPENALPLRRQMGYCTQNSGLFPHLSVSQNISIMGRLENQKKSDIAAKVDELLRLVHLEPKEFSHKRPHQLSGGQQQRVAIARALFMNPKLIIMDEPFGALDPITRGELQSFFVDLQKNQGLTVVLITHDLAEAFKMSEQIILLNQGHIEQMGPPSDFLIKPKSDFVVHFVKSHSPGQVLKSIKISSLINKDIWSSHKIQSGFEVKHFSSGIVKVFSDDKSLVKFHKSEGQNYIYWICDEDIFLGMSRLTSPLELNSIYVSDSDSILGGINFLLGQKFKSVAVTGAEKKLKGCFSHEVLGALN